MARLEPGSWVDLVAKWRCSLQKKHSTRHGLTGSVTRHEACCLAVLLPCLMSMKYGVRVSWDGGSGCTAKIQLYVANTLKLESKEALSKRKRRRQQTFEAEANTCRSRFLPSANLFVLSQPSVESMRDIFSRRPYIIQYRYIHICCVHTCFFVCNKNKLLIYHMQNL